LECRQSAAALAISFATRRSSAALAPSAAPPDKPPQPTADRQAAGKAAQTPHRKQACTHSSSQKATGSRGNMRGMRVLLLIAVSGWVTAAVAAGCRPADSSNAVTAEPTGPGVQEPSALLEPSSRTVDLGLVPQAGSERETFELTNPGSEPVTVASVTSSCECLKLRPAPPFTVPPGRSLAVTAELDLSAHKQGTGFASPGREYP